MKKKGFTIVELLAVIIILGLIGIIIVPTVNNTIEKQRKKAFQTSISGLLTAVKSESQNAGFTTKVYRFNTNKLYECDENGDNCAITAAITTDGKITNGQGYVKVTKDGLYYLTIKTSKLCSFKTYFSDIITTDNMSYCDFGYAISYTIDEAMYYNNDGLERYFYLNSGSLNLVYENGLDIDPEIAIGTGFLSTTEGYLEITGVELHNAKFGTSSFCALYNSLNNDGVIKFYDHACES